MEKKISFVMNEDDITIKITSGENPKDYKTCIIKNRMLNAKEIYDLLDYKPGDVYSYEKIHVEGKDKDTLEELMNFFESITSQITNMKLLSDLSGFEQQKLTNKNE